MAFSERDGRDLLAIVERRGRVTIWSLEETGTPALQAEISGPETRLEMSDSIAFVGSEGDALAVADYRQNHVCFFDLADVDSQGRLAAPAWVLESADLAGPDGVAVSQDGEWLGVCNHSGQSVSVFARDRRGGRLRFHPHAASVVADRSMRAPHSLAFDADTLALFVSNSGARHVSVYPCRTSGAGPSWSGGDAEHLMVVDKATFDAPCWPGYGEGGPKGIALHGRELFICSPEQGARVMTLPPRG